jgi:hypothetical protein
MNAHSEEEKPKTMVICIDQTVMLNGMVIRCDLTDAFRALDPFQNTIPAWRMNKPITIAGVIECDNIE